MHRFPFESMVSYNSLDFAFSLDVAIPQDYGLPENPKTKLCKCFSCKKTQAQQLKVFFF